MLSRQLRSEPCHDKTCLLDFRPGPDTNQAVQPQKMVRGLKFQRDCTFFVAKAKALISCTVTVQLICTFVFANAKIRFSHDAAHLTVHTKLNLYSLGSMRHFLSSNEHEQHTELTKISQLSSNAHLILNTNKVTNELHHEKTCFLHM